MPVNRACINQYATTDTNLYQALTQLANFSDALEQAGGLDLNAATSSTAVAAPGSASWQIDAAEGHFLLQITDAAVSIANPPPVQHQVASATDQQFDANSSVSTFTLGLGQLTLDVVDPNVAKFWRLRSRYPGSGWNSWLAYATASGVAALNAGPLRTS